MAYFGSTIEGAAGTALQAANSIADREAASAWQRYNAMAQQQAQAANMAQMRFANQQAMRQAAESDYWRRKQAAEEASRYQTTLGLTREQMAQQAAERELDRGFRREQMDLAKKMREDELGAKEAEFENLPNVYFNPLKQATEKLNALEKPLKDAADKVAKVTMDANRAVGRFAILNPVSGFYEPIKGATVADFDRNTMNSANEMLRQALAEQQKLTEQSYIAQNTIMDLGAQMASKGISIQQDPMTKEWYAITKRNPQPQKIGNWLTTGRMTGVSGGGVMGDADMSQNQLRQQYQFKAPPMNFTQFERVSPERISLTPSWIHQTPEATANLVTPRVSTKDVVDQMDYFKQQMNPAQSNAFVHRLRELLAGEAGYRVTSPFTDQEWAQFVVKPDVAAVLNAIPGERQASIANKALIVANAIRSTKEVPIGSSRITRSVETNYPQFRVSVDATNNYWTGGTATNAPVAVPVAPPTAMVTNRTAVLPMPQVKSALIPGQVYQTPRGIGRWNGTVFTSVE